MAFSIRVDILSALGLEFDLSHEQQGRIFMAHIWGFPIAILLVGPLCDLLGMGRLLGLASIAHIAGVVMTIFSPNYGVLLMSTLLIGLANGTVEAVINPLAATMYSDQKTHKLNVLHAWWPGGLVLGGLAAYLLTQVTGGVSPSLAWKLKMGLVLIPAVIYGLMLIGQKFPMTERAQAGISTGAMFKEVFRPGLLLLLLCMCLTAITELGPAQWVGSVLTDTVGIQGILFLVYTSGLMFVLRFFAGPIVHKITPFGLLTVAALLSAVGLFWLSHSFTPGVAFAAATVFGVGIAYFWPTMLGVVSEQYPRSGALALALAGAMGMFAAGAAGPYMGAIYDKRTIDNLPKSVAKLVVKDGRYRPKAAEQVKGEKNVAALKEAEKQGAALAFRSVSVLPVVLVVLFGLMLIYHQARGGYRAVTVKGSGGKRKK